MYDVSMKHAVPNMVRTVIDALGTECHTVLWHLLVLVLYFYQEYHTCIDLFTIEGRRNFNDIHEVPVTALSRPLGGKKCITAYGSSTLFSGYAAIVAAIEISC